jgi:polyferredoxin
MRKLFKNFIAVKQKKQTHWTKYRHKGIHEIIVRKTFLYVVVIILTYLFLMSLGWFVLYSLIFARSNATDGMINASFQGMIFMAVLVYFMIINAVLIMMLRW